MRKSKGTAALMVAAGALGVSTAQASAASFYVASSSTLSATATGGPTVFIDGNIVVKCNNNTATLSGASTGITSLPATLSGPSPSFANCTTTVGGLPRSVTVTSSGTWLWSLLASDYDVSISVGAGSVKFTVGTCTITVNASTLPAKLTGGGAPVLGSPADTLRVKGAVNVSHAGACPATTTALLVADGSVAAGSTTGPLHLSGTITEY
ncbi:hypothetical protein [Patulibacter defluvii]|uniref:hypothetical protein n=1 Tax=Patulibacter defluvii TaxID=3095358 RepID=UPI002A7529D1|nr:hypothetical protein [Patulibacter sp. DM4]